MGGVPAPSATLSKRGGCGWVGRPREAALIAPGPRCLQGRQLTGVAGRVQWGPGLQLRWGSAKQTGWPPHTGAHLNERLLQVWRPGWATAGAAGPRAHCEGPGLGAGAGRLGWGAQAPAEPWPEQIPLCLGWEGRT